jgi:hypothetical protein
MTQIRISETGSGITGEFNTQIYDTMMRNMCDKGWIETNLILKEEIGLFKGTGKTMKNVEISSIDENKIIGLLKVVKEGS